MIMNGEQVGTKREGVVVPFKTPFPHFLRLQKAIEDHNRTEINYEYFEILIRYAWTLHLERLRYSNLLDGLMNNGLKPESESTLLYSDPDFRRSTVIFDGSMVSLACRDNSSFKTKMAKKYQ